MATGYQWVDTTQESIPTIGAIMMEGGWDDGAAGEQGNDSGSGDGAGFDNDGGNG